MFSVSKGTSIHCGFSVVAKTNGDLFKGGLSIYRIQLIDLSCDYYSDNRISIFFSDKYYL